MSIKTEWAQELAATRGRDYIKSEQATRRCIFCDATIPRTMANHGCAAENEHKRKQGIKPTNRRSTQ